jgi:hypothetical protein
MAMAQASSGRAGPRIPRWHRIAAWLSAGANLLLFDGSPDETVSGRSWRQGVMQQPPSPRWARRRELIDRLFFFDPGHCQSSHEYDRIFARFILGIDEKDIP